MGRINMISANPMLHLVLQSLITVFASAMIYLLQKCRPFRNLPYMVRQVIIGVIFGGIAILGTERGIMLNDAVINFRDGSVLCAGLLFGAPAGVIAGLIGGIERWFSVYWGVSSFTRVACSVATIFAGIYSAVLRKSVFEDRRPSGIVAFATGIVMEVLHVSLVFVTNFSQAERAANVVKTCTVPLLLCNAGVLLVSCSVITLLAGDTVFQRVLGKHLSREIRKHLFISVVVAFIITSLFMYFTQTGLAENQTETLLKLTVDDISQSIAECKNETEIKGVARNRHVGETGFILIIDTSGNIISGPSWISDLESLREGTNVTTEEGRLFKGPINGEDYYGVYGVNDKYAAVAMMPCAESLRNRDIALYINTFLEILVFAALYMILFILIRRLMIDNLNKVNEGLKDITDGDLSRTVDVRSVKEFSALSDGINSTVDSLKEYIHEAESRIDAELKFAKDIQVATLPTVFPAFPGRNDFDIYALMDTAKEVGGDFYDFYFTENGRLNILIADVSGKGIPAAMFMMRSKTALRNLADHFDSVGDVFAGANNQLCTGNDAGMFVTAWQGGIDLGTGNVFFANAGHNPPVVSQNGEVEFLRSRPGFVLAGMENITYRQQNLIFAPGDFILLYTDGITEAINENGELYGEDRLQRIVNAHRNDDMKSLCEAVKADVDDFVGEAEQFDDETLLAFRYIGQ